MALPPVDLQKALDKKKLHHTGDFRVMKHGETIKLKKD